VAIVVVSLAKSHGPEYIFAAVILAGIFQATADFLRLGKLIRLGLHMSAIETLNKITDRYKKVGKKDHLKHLSPPITIYRSPTTERSPYGSPIIIFHIPNTQYPIPNTQYLFPPSTPL